MATTAQALTEYIGKVEAGKVAHPLVAYDLDYLTRLATALPQASYGTVALAAAVLRDTAAATLANVHAERNPKMRSALRVSARYRNNLAEILDKADQLGKKGRKS